MAFKFAESFDHFTTAPEGLLTGNWSTQFNNPVTSTTTRFGAGRSFQVGGSGAYIRRESWPNGLTTNTVFFCVGHRNPGDVVTTGQPFYGGYVYLLNGSTAVFTVHFDNDGSIKVYRGDKAALLGTYSSAFVAGAWNHFQFKIVLDGAAGSVAIRKNGDTVDTWSVTGVNTSGGTNAVNGIHIGGGTTGSPGLHLFDDLLVWDDSDSIAPNTWVGDIRAFSAYPSADTAQKDFASAAVSNTPTAFSSNLSQSANTSRSARITASYTGTLTGVRITLSAAYTGNIRVYIYTNTSGNGYANLLSSSATINNPAAGNVDFTFGSPASVVKGDTYHVVFAFDGTPTMPLASSTSAASTAAGVVTVSSAPNNPANNSTATSPVHCTITYQPTNAGSVSESGMHDGDTTFVASSTVGAIDLYDMEDLPTTPAFILGVQARVTCRKSDAAARSGQIILKSGGATSLPTGVVQSTSYQGMVANWATDPNTGAAWTASAVNALQLGVKVSA